jgi:hypothetical protein
MWMLEFVRSKVSERKRRLLACGCCRGIWHLLVDSRSRRAVEVAERWADSQAEEHEVQAALLEATAARDDQQAHDESAEGAAINSLAICGLEEGGVWFPDQQAVEDALRHAVDYAAHAAGNAAWDEGAGWRSANDLWGQAFDAERQRQTSVIYEIFGNPFRLVAIDPPWLTSTVSALATGIYADRAFDRLPILADALQDAGCDNDDILSHLRSDGPHVKGCWALDLVLGKS